jgi:hypothetical protein
MYETEVGAGEQVALEERELPTYELFDEEYVELQEELDEEIEEEEQGSLEARLPKHKY